MTKEHNLDKANGNDMKRRKLTCSVVITQEDTGWYVATDVTTGVASQGRSYEEVMANLREALELYYEDTSVEYIKPAMFTTLEVIA